MSFFSTAGPAIVRMPTPSSSRTMYASYVLPRPGGPASSTWSSASPRAFAAMSAISSCSFTRSCPTNSSSQRGRSVCSTLPRRPRPRAPVRRTSSCRPPQGLPHTLLGRRGRIRLRRARARRRRASSRARRARRARRRGRRRRRAADRRDRHRRRELLLQLEHDALGRLLADAGDRLEARGVLAHDRAAQLVGGRAGDDRERDLRPDAVHATGAG